MVGKDKVFQILAPLFICSYVRQMASGRYTFTQHVIAWLASSSVVYYVLTICSTLQHIYICIYIAKNVYNSRIGRARTRIYISVHYGQCFWASFEFDAYSGDLWYYLTRVFSETRFPELRSHPPAESNWRKTESSQIVKTIGRV